LILGIYKWIIDIGMLNVEIGTEAAQFPEKENVNGIFVAVWPLFLDTFLRNNYLD
jgi:hypothetical protein